MNWIDEYVAIGGWGDANLPHPGADLVLDVRPLFNGGPKVEEVVNLANRMIFLSQDHKMLLRCFSGRDRAPFVAMVYISQKYGLPYDEAYQYVKVRRPQTVFHWDWVEMLYE